MENAELLHRVDEQLTDLGLARVLLDGLFAELSAIKGAIIVASAAAMSKAEDLQSGLPQPEQAAAEMETEPQNLNPEASPPDEKMSVEALAERMCEKMISIAAPGTEVILNTESQPEIENNAPKPENDNGGTVLQPLLPTGRLNAEPASYPVEVALDRLVPAESSRSGRLGFMAFAAAVVASTSYALAERDELLEWLRLIYASLPSSGSIV